jgi:predicted transcriptional regulator
MRNVLSVSLPERMARELNGFAKATGRNKSDIIKESLSNYLWEIKFKETRKRFSARAKKAGFLTDGLCAKKGIHPLPPPAWDMRPVFISSNELTANR